MLDWLIIYIYIYILCDSFVDMNWHKSYFATLYNGDNANQSYQYTFKEGMGMNQHELYIKLIFIIISLFSEAPVIVMRVVMSHQFLTWKLLCWSQTRELHKFLSSLLS